MPTIPEFKRNTPSIPDAPIVANVPSGLDSDAIAGTRLAVGVSQELFSIANDYKESSDKDFASKQSLNDFDEFNREKLAIENQTDFSNPNESYSEKIKKLINDKLKRGQQNAPNENARRLYVQRASNIFDNELVGAFSKETQKRVSAIEGNILLDYNRRASSLVEIPNYGSLETHVTEFEKTVDDQNKLLSVEARKELKLKGSEQIVSGFLDGLLVRDDGAQIEAFFLGQASSQKRSQIQKTESVKKTLEQALTDGNITQEIYEKEIKKGNRTITVEQPVEVGFSGMDVEPGSGLDKYISPEKRRDYLIKAQSAKLRVKSHESARLRRQVEDNIQFISTNGLKGSDADVLIPRINLAVQSKIIDSEVGDEYKIAIASSAARYDIVKSLSGTPTVNINQQSIQRAIDQTLGASIDTVVRSGSETDLASRKTFQFRVKTELQKDVVKIADDIKKQRSSDGLAYVIGSNAKLREVSKQSGSGPVKNSSFLKEALRLQKQLGIPQRVLTNQQRDQYINLFNSLKNNPEKGVAAFNQMRNHYGDYFDEALGEIVKKEKDLSHLWLAAKVGSDASREKILGNIYNKDLSESSRNKNESLDKNLPNAVKTAVSAYSSPLTRQMTNSIQIKELQESMIEPVLNEAKRIHALDQNNRNANDIAKEAVKNILGETFEPVTSGRSSLLVPKSQNGKQIDPRVVGSFVGYYSKEENIKKLNIGWVNNFNEKQEDKGKSDQEKDRLAIAAITSGAPRWEVDRSVGKITLVYTTPSGQKKIVRDRLGNEISRTFLDVMNESENNAEILRGVR